MDKQPKLMNYMRMKDVFDAHKEQILKHAFISNELAILYGDPNIFKIIIRQLRPPFIINDHRMGLIVKGHLHVRVNLVEKVFEQGMLIFVGPGTIIQPISYADDLEIYGIGLFDDFPMPQLPPAFNGQVRDFQMKAEEGEFSIARRIIDTIWHLIHLPDYNRQTASSLVAALMQLYDGAYRRHTDMLQASLSREQSIFDRFIQLVNQHCAEQHQIGYYADRMCLTERYMSTIIRQMSGTTAKEWIDRAIITRIKVELKHSDKSVAQISEEANFPNPSFFSKYFKRLTGLTPLEYRLSK